MNFTGSISIMEQELEPAEQALQQNCLSTVSKVILASLQKTVSYYFVVV